MRASTDKARRRARARGSVAFESLIALIVPLTIFTGMVFMGETYRGKLSAIRAAKEETWVSATRGCTGGAPGEASVGRFRARFALASEGGLEGMGGIEFVQTFLGMLRAVGAPGTEIFGRIFQQVKASSDGTAGVRDAYGRASVDVVSRAHAGCNEIPEDNQLLTVLDIAFNLLWAKFG